MPRFSIDLSPELNTWLEERAKAEGRSKAKQVAYILKLFKDTIGDHSAGLLRPPGYSLQDEQWLSLKGNGPAKPGQKGKQYVITEEREE